MRYQSAIRHLRSAPFTRSALNDEEVAALARGGDALAVETLVHRYVVFARSRAQSYFLVGADRDDIVQEGMIGLFKAVRDYRDDRRSSFRGFAELCITRQIITAIKTATRQKHVPLNSYVSWHLSAESSGDSERNLDEVLPTADIQDPAEILVNIESVEDLRDCLSDMLSSFEARVLRLHLEGKTYHEIGDILQRCPKSVDNALQRLKRKLDALLRERRECAEAI